MLKDSFINRMLSKKNKAQGDKYSSMSDSDLRAHAKDLKSKIPYARSQGTLVGGAVHDAWRAAQNEIEKRSKKRSVYEEAPANAIGGGNIAGAGVGPAGEPGVGPAAHRRHRRRNAANAPDPVMAPTMRRKTFSQFMRGE